MGHDKLHAGEHTDGTDDIQDATASQKGLMTAAYASKLDDVVLSWAKGEAEKLDVTPPGTPVDGGYYLIQTGATGIWSGHGGEVGYYTTAGGWTYTIPDPEDCWISKAENGWYITKGATSWSLLWTMVDWSNISSRPTTFTPSAHGSSHTDGTDDIAIHAATEKTSHTDLDEIALADQADSWALKRLTIANLKAAIYSTFMYPACYGGSGPSADMAGNQTVYMNAHGFFGTESDAEDQISCAGTITKLVVHVGTNNLGGSSTITLRKNNSDMAITVTIPAGGTGYYTSTGSVSYSEGDTFCLKGVLGGTNFQHMATRGGHVRIKTAVI